MKQVLVYRKTGRINKDGSSELELIRNIRVASTFVGIGRNTINKLEFKKFCEDLEPTHTFYNVIDI